MNALQAISHQMQQHLDKELHPGERIIWSQQPDPRLLVFKSSIFFMLSTPFFLIGVYWLANLSAGLSFGFSKDFMFLFFLVFGVFGVVLSPAWIYWEALRTVYAITDQRAILIISPWRRTIYSFAGEQLADIQCVENKTGRSDIVFHREKRSGTRGRIYYQDVGFLGIKDIREVEDFLRQLCANNQVAFP